MGHRIRIDWPGGNHEFALGLGELRALQTSLDIGPEQLFTRFADGTWRVDDLIETHRRALIGAGMENREAAPLVLRLFEQYPLADFRASAQKIVGAALIGVEDDPLGGVLGAMTPPENGSSAPSTDPEL